MDWIFKHFGKFWVTFFVVEVVVFVAIGFVAFHFISKYW